MTNDTITKILSRKIHNEEVMKGANVSDKIKVTDKPIIRTKQIEIYSR